MGFVKGVELERRRGTDICGVVVYQLPDPRTPG